MKKVFLVSTEKGTKIISESVLVKELKQSIKEANAKVKQRDLENFATEALNALDGLSVSEEYFKGILNDYTTALVGYASLTPFGFYKRLNETCSCLNEAQIKTNE